jgi:catechol 2,3-dioxygenase
MLSPTTTVGPVRLFVPDLDRSRAFYEDVLGFALLKSEGDTLFLGGKDGTPLLELVERPTSIRPGRRSPGLFHFAVLFPSRAALGQELSHLIESGWRLSGAGDHLVSEALYLDDPDGNGIELYADRPRETWKFVNGRVVMDTLSVDIDSLVAEGRTIETPWNGLPAGTIMGHVHLKVSDLAATEKFYTDLIGFDLMETMPQALFVAAGGYHHHLGLNTWMSAGSPPVPEGALGLDRITINVGDQSSFDEIVARLGAAGVAVTPIGNGVLIADPSQNRIKLQPK